jgi:multidrug resistance protein, MATE family
MSIKEHIRTNIFLALPVMLSQLGHVLMGVMDNVMVGHVGATPLAGAALANVVFNVLLLFGIGVSYAITPLVAEADGQRDEAKIISVFRHGFLINMMVGILLVIVVIAGKNILYHLEQPQEVIQQAVPYLSIITFSLIPVLIFQSFRQFADGLSLTYLSLVVMIAANFLNILLNYTFIYGHFGFEPMGLVGAGYATLISRIFMAMALALYVFYHSSLKQYRGIFLLKNYSWKLFNTMLHIGIPAGLQFIFEVAAFDFSAVMMGWFGTNTLAAHQIAINLATISYMTTSGLGAAAVIRIGNFIGQKDAVNLKRSVYTLLGLALALMSLFGIAFLFGRFWLPSLYIGDWSVIRIAAPLVIIAGVFQLSDGMQVVCAGALRGLQDVKIPSLLIFISYWVIGLPLGYWLAFTLNWGPNGIWIGLLIGLTLVAIALFIRLRRLMNLRISNSIFEIENR